MKDFQIIIGKQKFCEQEKKDQGPTVITLKELEFAFAMLGLESASATVLFLVEIRMERI